MWEYLLHRIFGIDTGHERIRLGGGVLINTTHVMLGIFAAAVGIAWALSSVPLYALGVIGILALLVIVFLLGSWRFADLNPDQAAMGGSEWRRFREAQLAAKHHKDVPALPPTTDPLQVAPPSTPSLEAPEEE